MQRLLNEAEVAVLQDVAFYQYLTAEQLRRLRYGRSINYAREVLARLEGSEEKGGFLRRESFPKPQQRPTVKMPYVYTLTSKGARAVRESGTEVPSISSQKEHTYLFLKHVLAVNEFLISAYLLARHEQGAVLHRCEHEQTLKRYPFAGVVQGQRKTVSSDGFVHLVHNNIHYPMLLEVDRGTEERKAWQEKLRRLLAFLDQGYQQRYGTDLVTVAVLVAMSEQRLADARRGELLGWTEHVLRVDGRLNRGDIFQFSSIQPQTMPEPTYFFTKHWRVPFRPENYPLMEA